MNSERFCAGCLLQLVRSSPCKSAEVLGPLCILAFLCLFFNPPEVARSETIDVELIPATSGIVPGRNRPGTPLLHLDFWTSRVHASAEGFLIDSVSAGTSAPSFTFDSDLQGWFNEPEEGSIILGFEPDGIDGGSMRIGQSTLRDVFELEHDYDIAWNSQQGFYESITLKVRIDDPSMGLFGVDFLIDDGTQRALYCSGRIPEPGSLTLAMIGLIGTLTFRISRKTNRKKGSAVGPIGIRC